MLYKCVSLSRSANVWLLEILSELSAFLIGHTDTYTQQLCCLLNYKMWNSVRFHCFLESGWRMKENANLIFHPLTFWKKKKVLPIPSILQVYIKGSLRDRWPGHTSTPAKAMLVPHTHMHAWFGGVCVKAHHKHSRHLISLDDNSGLWYFVDLLQSHSVNFAHPGITFSYCPSINSLIGCYLSQYFE